MALYYHHEKQTIFNSITKEIFMIVKNVYEKEEYELSTNEEDVGYVHTYKVTTHKIQFYISEFGLLWLLLNKKQCKKISEKEKSNILNKWKLLISNCKELIHTKKSDE